MKSLEIHIQNIHVRYEDDFCKPEHPFSAGFLITTAEIKVIFAVLIKKKHEFLISIIKTKDRW